MTELIRKELINSTFMYCYRRLGNTADAEDLAQDILCEALSGLGKGRTIENFDAWYWTLAGGHQEHRCRHSALLQKIV